MKWERRFDGLQALKRELARSWHSDEAHNALTSNQTLLPPSSQPIGYGGHVAEELIPVPVA
jgi:hypothetical protein